MRTFTDKEREAVNLARNIISDKVANNKHLRGIVEGLSTALLKMHPTRLEQEFDKIKKPAK